MMPEGFQQHKWDQPISYYSFQYLFGDKPSLHRCGLAIEVVEASYSEKGYEAIELLLC